MSACPCSLLTSCNCITPAKGEALLAFQMPTWLAVWLHTVWQAAGAVSRLIMLSALASAAHRIVAATAAPTP